MTRNPEIQEYFQSRQKQASTPDLKNFSFPYPVLTHNAEHPGQTIIPIAREILADVDHMSINGVNNPVYSETAATHFNKQTLLDTVIHKRHIAENDARKGEKQEAIGQFDADAHRLVEHVKNFELAFAQEFDGTALFDEKQPFTAELVFRLRNFLKMWIPTWYPIWDCNPITHYSREQQVMNFAQRTLKHVDCDMLYVYEYSSEWNRLVDTQPLTPEEKAQLKLDPYFMMSRALLHDLGRWFTQDSRAHEEIPASIAIDIGLRRELLTLDAGEAVHPREFDVSKPMNKKTLIRIIEFFSDFNSKPHDDFVWHEVVVLLQYLESLKQESQNGVEESESTKISKKGEYLKWQKVAQDLEQLRQSELRHIHLAPYYFLYSGRGYAPTTVEESKNAVEILENQYGASNPDKLTYLKTEARMLETGRIFLDTLGLSPVKMREQVMAKWQMLDPNDDNIVDCFPELQEEFGSELNNRIKSFTEAIRQYMAPTNQEVQLFP